MDPPTDTVFRAKWIDVRDEAPDSNDHSQILAIVGETQNVELLTWNEYEPVNTDDDIYNWYTTVDGACAEPAVFRYWMPAPSVRVSHYNCEIDITVKYRELKTAYKNLLRGDYTDLIISDSDEEIAN